MTDAASVLATFGTEERIPENRLLRAGLLSALLEDGNLRTISFGGSEAIRGINYLARDTSWGTYRASLSDLTIHENSSSFQVAYKGLCSGPEGRFAYRMTIRGEASGVLTMEAVGEALIDFPTNRTGFVVLHPAEAASGKLTIRHSDDTIEQTVFPDAISPDQPAFDIEAMTHEITPDVFCTVSLQGDAFEMEDQRNWSDASFKTYIRPLSKPRPYILRKGAPDTQRLVVRFQGPAPSGSARDSDVVTLTLGAPAGRLPALALFLDADHLVEAMRNAGDLRGAAQDVILRFDMSRGHGALALSRAAAFADAIGARIAIEAVFDARDPAIESNMLFEAVRQAGIRPSAILVAPRREFKTRPSATLPEGEHSVSALMSALRRTGIEASIGAGTPSYFTEFNRNPPAGDAEFIYFGVSAIVHAADDRSVMETLGVYPALVESARRLCPEKPVWLGPCTIGMRHNPYGDDVAPNPSACRQPMAAADPRQAALFGAAFAVGVAAKAAALQVSMLTLAAPSGPFGVLHDVGRPKPIMTVQNELAAAAGAPCQTLQFDGPSLSGIAFESNGGSRAILANLSPDPVVLKVPALFASAQRIENDAGLSVVTVAEGSIRLPGYRTIILSA